MRTCPFHGCGAEIATRLFACSRHWKAMAADDRARISGAYDEYLRGKMGLEDLRRIHQSVLGTRGTA